MLTRFCSTFLSFRGRISRLTYWKRSLQAGLIALPFVFAGLLAASYSRVAFFALVGIGLAISLGSWASITVRRFHDLGRNGWLGFVAVGLSGLLSYAVEEASGALFVMAVAASCVSLALLIYLGFVRGTPGANAYGPNPHAPDA
ncbi:DUF805 domain-containing protein [Methylopila sp. Yamaguchi]|uniref:DUF805 domain-containing protein n=1 Tax=Methylopila sp. Yamaguchi TaxID=1437817 RepID=UPI000CB26652|nr:DUF805 domain-containing protein [Methylopila sp. Yamaguchi]GBD48728.1 hypothetical protein METY_1941 [Methylopila sp. Yamaguchi]